MNKFNKRCVLISVGAIILAMGICAALACVVVFRLQKKNAKTETNTTDITATNDTLAENNSTMPETTTTVPVLVSLTGRHDPILGIYNTSAGGDVYERMGIYPSTEGPKNAIDMNLDTKYLNFGQHECLPCVVNDPGIGTGYLVIPAISNLTIARAVLFATGNDYPERDPLTITLEGATTSNIASLYLAESWTLIYNGSTGIDATTDPGRSVYVAPQHFSNTIPYTSYRLLITSQRSAHNSVQYAEGRILGYVVS